MKNIAVIIITSLLVAVIALQILAALNIFPRLERVEVCPVDAISMRNGKAAIDPTKCIGCRRCVAGISVYQPAAVPTSPRVGTVAVAADTLKAGKHTLAPAQPTAVKKTEPARQDKNQVATPPPSSLSRGQPGKTQRERRQMHRLRAVRHLLPHRRHHDGGRQGGDRPRQMHQLRPLRYWQQRGIQRLPGESNLRPLRARKPAKLCGKAASGRILNIAVDQKRGENKMRKNKIQTWRKP